MTTPQTHHGIEPDRTTPTSLTHSTAPPLISAESCLGGAARPAEYPLIYSSVNAPFRSGTVGQMLLHTLPAPCPHPAPGRGTLPQNASEPCPGAGYPAPNPAPKGLRPCPASPADRLPVSYKNGQFGLKNGPNQVANSPPQSRAGGSFIMGPCSPCPHVCTNPITVHMCGHPGHPPYKRFLDRQGKGGENRDE